MGGWLADVSVNEFCPEADLLKHRTYLEHRSYLKRPAAEVADEEAREGNAGARAAEGRRED